MDVFTLRFPAEDSLTDDELFRICTANKELRIERDEFGQLLIMSPAGSFSSNRNFVLNGIFAKWVELNPHLGYGFDSSGGFILPDRSMRSPDAAWIKKERWESLTQDDQEKFAPICPDFVIELRSKSDSLPQLKHKMEKWIANGVELGWLIDPIEQKAYVYQPNKEVIEVLDFQHKLTGNTLLPGFELDLQRLS
ncbi:MAG: Uma2 family endonuclease [Cyclobacteriaceae bacterium]|nr:Uma2 family endonuclease [Cyclobacteriaceae bacterium]